MVQCTFNLICVANLGCFRLLLKQITRSSSSCVDSRCGSREDLVTCQALNTLLHDRYKFSWELLWPAAVRLLRNWVAESLIRTTKQSSQCEWSCISWVQSTDCGELSSGHQTHLSKAPRVLFADPQQTDALLRNDLTRYTQKHRSGARFILKHMKLCSSPGQSGCPKFAINEGLQAARRSKHSQSYCFFIFQGIKCLAAGPARPSLHFSGKHEICTF